MNTAREKRIRRHRRVRAKIRGTADRPRMAIFRSNRHIGAQLIDDAHGMTLVAAYDEAGSRDRKRMKNKNKVARAGRVGADLAEKARAQGIVRAVFDRGGYTYHGAVKAVAESAREGGLKI